MKKSALAALVCSLSLLAGVSAVPQNRTVLAILDFKNATGDEANAYLSIAVPEMFATNLSQSPEITVLERERVEKILKEQGLMMAGVTEGDERKIGRLLAATQLLTGSIIKAGTVLRLDARLVEVASGKILAADKKQCASIDEIIDGVDTLSESIVRKVTGKEIVFTKDVEPVTPAPAGKDLVDIEMLPDNPYYLAGSKKPYFLRTGFIAREYTPAGGRIPLNVCVVLDHSGSMDEKGKLDYAKESIRFIIRNLDKRDTFSLVIYDNNVEVAVEPTAVTDRNAIIAKVDKVVSGSSTNLSGGMMEGVEQVKKNMKQGQVNRVLLISDGLANVGVTEPSKIQLMAKSAARQGITISSFGVGQDFNEKLMTGIAEFGSANYYYISAPDKIADIFSRELKGLLAMVAQNCAVEVELLDGTTVETVYGFAFDRNARGVSVKFGDIVSEEKKLALLRIIPPQKAGRSGAIARITCTFDDAVSGRGRITRKKDVTLTVTADAASVSSNYNAAVLKDADMYLSTQKMEEAMEMVDDGRIDDAKKNLDETLVRTRSSLKKYNSRELKKQVMNIIEYRENLQRVAKQAESPASMKDSDEYRHMQKSGRSRQYEMQKKK